MKRMSRTITLKLLTSLTLTGCLVASGCGPSDEPHEETTRSEETEPVDTTWYDENGNPIPEEWKTDAQGNRVLDSEGRPIPAHGVPHDRHGHLWVYHHGLWVPPIIVFGPSYRSAPMYHSGPVRSSSGITGGSGYRTPSTTTPYRSPSGTGSSVLHPVAPSRPSASASTSAPRSGSSISRGGFGSTGSSSASS